LTYNEFCQSYKAQLMFKATRGQWLIFPLLVFREQVDYDTLIMNAWPDTDAEPDNPRETIKVQITKLRSKIKQYGLNIHIVWGRGYYMTKEDRAKALKMAEEAMSK